MKVGFRRKKGGKPRKMDGYKRHSIHPRAIWEKKILEWQHGKKIGGWGGAGITTITYSKVQREKHYRTSRHGQQQKTHPLQTSALRTITGKEGFLGGVTTP